MTDPDRVPDLVHCDSHELPIPRRTVNDAIHHDVDRCPVRRTKDHWVALPLRVVARTVEDVHRLARELREATELIVLEATFDLVVYEPNCRASPLRHRLREQDDLCRCELLVNVDGTLEDGHRNRTLVALPIREVPRRGTHSLRTRDECSDDAQRDQPLPRSVHS